MYFNNLQLFRLPSPWPITLAELEAQLASRRFTPCGSQDAESRGWVAPVDGGDAMVHSVGGQWLIALCIEQRLLPTSVVRQATEERAAQLEDAQGFKPRRRQMKDLKEDVTRELMPHAFTTRRKVYAWIDPKAGWFGIDAASINRAEDVLEALRQSLDAFPLTMLRTEISPVSAMAGWLASDEPEGFTVDMDCELRSVTEDRAAVRYTHHALDGDEIKTHLTEGKLPTRLAMTFDDRVSFVLTEKGEIKRLQILDVVKEAAEGDDAAELFDAQFALMTCELGRLIPAVVEALGGEVRT